MASLPSLTLLSLCVLLLWPENQAAPTSVCYGDLGCFTTEGHFKHFVLPMRPSDIRTTFYAYTRGHHSEIEAGHSAGLESAHFSHARQTIMIVHGYMNNITTSWLTEMRNALLSEGDYNVIVVDWGHGAKTGYNVAAANTIVVGAEIAHILKYLHDHFHMNYGKVHLIGHSLGAQACGYAGSKIHGLGRISGLDPAQPFFEDHDATVRLDPSDANFVDVIHTDATKFIGIEGYGMVKPCGHVDFYPNGGNNQPGCEERHIIGAIEDFLNGKIKAAAGDVSCSHSRAHHYYVHTINPSACPLQGYTCSDYHKFESGDCFSCSHHNCPVMGFHAQPAHKGSYYLNTLEKEPYCGAQYYVEVKLADKMWDGYGRIFIQLIGSGGESSYIEFNKKSERFRHGQVENHVIVSEKNVGTVKEIKVKFVKTDGLGGLFALKQLAFHMVTVKPEDSEHSVEFCAHDHVVKDDHVIALFRSHGC
ncbi:pancreatic triacylglycerol lipase-like [Liolophura sinensis]|uniref:pancreatic triacylglycerol lipase-like n=1 Tax=Liolophura sinensis TaxID=3198878 RepID=UPI003158C676